MPAPRTSKAKPPGKAKRGRGDGEGRDEWGCSPSEALFVLEYLKDRNATQAAIRAGYSPASAGAAGSRMMKRDHVAKAVQARAVAIAADIEVDVKHVLMEWAAIGFADIGEVFDHNNRLLPLHKMPRRVRAAIQSIERDGAKWKVKFHPKVPALGDMARYLGMFEADNKQKSDAVADLINEISSRGGGLPIKR